MKRLRLGDLDLRHLAKAVRQVDYKLEAESALRDKLSQIAFPIIPRGTVLLEKGASRPTPERFASYAEERKFGLIAVHTHARSGFSRYVLGSFAEALLACSTVPLLMINPSSEIKDHCDKLLFPTSFSETAKKGLLIAASFARTVGARLTVYHRWPEPPSWTLRGAHQEDYEGAKHRIVPLLRRAGEEWVEWARAQGVDAELRFDVGPGAISAETILSVAKETDARAIALFPEVAPTANAVFGAVAREVIRQADMPILALRMQ